MHATTPGAIIVGVDTHKDTHVAVAVTGLGARLGAISTPATATGYRQLAQWAHAQGTVLAFGIEGTGSYGAGLSRALTAQGCRVIEVSRPNRQLRRQRGKSDTIDAEAAARAVLAGEATAPPKSGNGDVEMIRHLKIARDTALKARTQAMVTLKTLLVNAPQPQRSPASARAVHRHHRAHDVGPGAGGPAARPHDLDHGLGQDGAARTGTSLAGARCRDQGA